MRTQTPLQCISPLDGRYISKVENLGEIFSEYGLIKYRIHVEVEWFIYLFNDLKLKGTKVLTQREQKDLRDLVEYFDVKSAERVKAIEKETNHDVKAVEYYMKENLKNGSLVNYLEFIHFACTSEDINNLAYALMIKEGLENEYIPVLSGVKFDLKALGKKYVDVSMLSRTHGQPASPTTVGKEFINFAARLDRQLKQLKKVEIFGKINGATGNYNAHYTSYPNIDWFKNNQKFVKNLGLKPNLYTTQIEPHDFYAELFDCMKRVNNIILDLDRDAWMYISYGFFKQKLKKGEVGSSTMPHKVNPIDFENSEGNVCLANALLEGMGSKLQVSRMQRDLSDSTVERNIGLCFGYSILAYKSTIKGLNKLEINKEKIKEDLDDNFAVLAEPIQTVMRRYKVEGAYEKLKGLTRGKKVTKAGLKKFLQKLDIPKAEIKRLEKLTPENYIGIAKELVSKFK